MKKLLLLLACGVLAMAGMADPARCLLVVNNRCTNIETLPLNSIAATLEASFAGDRFTLVNPLTALGDGASADSSRVMAQKLDCDFILTATIQQFVGESIGIPVVANKLKVRLSLNLAKAGTGDTVCGIMNSEYSKNYSIERVKEDNATLFEDILHGAVDNAAKKLLKKADSARISASAMAACKVFFGCNILGADIQIDGVSYGTLPAEIKVTPGIHRIEVSYLPYCQPFERREAKLFDGQTFAVALTLSDVGRAMREADRKIQNEQNNIDDARSERSELFKKQLALANELLNRYKASGATDDYVRRIVADGTSVYWKNSYGRVAVTDEKTEKIEFPALQRSEQKAGGIFDTSSVLKKLREILNVKEWL